jgi:hypothetical protein
VTLHQDDIPDLLAGSGRRERSRIALLSVAAVVVLGAGGLGVALLRSQDQPEALSVAQAASATTATGSARMTVRTQATPKAEMVMAGVVDFARERYVLRGSFAGQETEVRGIGADQWSRTQNLGGLRGKPWTHITRVDEPGQGISAAEPVRLLDELTAVGNELSRSRDGDRTVIVVRAPRSVLGSPDDDALADIRVEVDRDGRIRRLDMPADEKREAVSVTYDDFGVAVDVSPPPPTEVAEWSDVIADVLTRTDPKVREQFPDLDDRFGCGLFDEQRKKLAETTSEANRATFDKLLADAKKACEARR